MIVVLWMIMLLFIKYLERLILWMGGNCMVKFGGLVN